MSFEIGDYVKIINPNHFQFGFEGYIDEISCKIEEQPNYRIYKSEGLTVQIVTAKEYEIELIEELKRTEVKIDKIGKNLFEFNKNGIAIKPFRDIDEYAPDAVRYFVERKIETATEYEPYDYLKEEGEKDNMELLDIYESRKRRNIRGEYSEKRTKIINEDIFKNLTLNFEKQIVDLYKNEYDKEISFAVVLKDEMITKETKEKLDKIEKEEKEEAFKLIETLQEVRAQLELAKDYETQIKILKRYDIIGKDGKINA